MWIGDIFIHYKEGTLPNPRSGDTLCFEAVQAPNRDMALMQVIDRHYHSRPLLTGPNFHFECAKAPAFHTITGFKFRAYGKKRRS